MCKSWQRDSIITDTVKTAIKNVKICNYATGAIDAQLELYSGRSEKAKRISR